jgi:hypothetical protein
MPYKDPDPTDPNMLIGVMLPADAEATREMAYLPKSSRAQATPESNCSGYLKIHSMAALTARIEPSARTRPSLSSTNV